MTMSIRHPEAADRVTFEVEFDQHHGLLTHNPTIVTRLDDHNLRSLELHDATVGVFDVDFAAGKEADVGVHAQVTADYRFHVDRPAESGWIYHALHASRTSPSNFKSDAADYSALGSFHRSGDRIRRLRLAPNALASFRDGRFPDVLPRGLFHHVPSSWLAGTG
jgi:hypothetical protein